MSRTCFLPHSGDGGTNGRGRTGKRCRVVVTSEPETATFRHGPRNMFRAFLFGFPSGAASHYVARAPIATNPCRPTNVPSVSGLYRSNPSEIGLSTTHQISVRPSPRPLNDRYYACIHTHVCDLFVSIDRRTAVVTSTVLRRIAYVRQPSTFRFVLKCLPFTTIARCRTDASPLGITRPVDKNRPRLLS